MAQKNLIIAGAGGHAVSAVDVVESAQDYKIVGFVDSARPIGDLVLAYPVIGREHDLAELILEHDAHVFVAVGDNFQRQQYANRILDLIPSAQFASLIHSHAYVSPRAAIAPACIVMAQAVVNADSELDEGVIINTKASVDHECRLAPYSSLAPGSTIGGQVVIGERTSIGLGANVLHKVSIEADVCVGAGSLVKQNLDTPSCVVYGVPAKIVRERGHDEDYL